MEQTLTDYEKKYAKNLTGVPVVKNETKGRVEDVVDAIELLMSLPGCDKEACEREIGYFEKNTERMRYGDFKNRGLFVGCLNVLPKNLSHTPKYNTP